MSFFSSQHKGGNCYFLIAHVISCIRFSVKFNSIGKKSVQNPWGSNTLEWTAPVEQIHGNWPGEVPKVYRWPYDYSRPDAVEDFVPQNVPDDVVPVEWAGDPHGAASAHNEVSSSDAKSESVVHFSWFKKLGMRLGVL